MVYLNSKSKFAFSRYLKLNLKMAERFGLSNRAESETVHTNHTNAELL